MALLALKKGVCTREGKRERERLSLAKRRLRRRPGPSLLFVLLALEYPLSYKPSKTDKQTDRQTTRLVASLPADLIAEPDVPLSSATYFPHWPAGRREGWLAGCALALFARKGLIFSCL